MTTTVQGIPFTELAQRFGTPLFVYDTAVLAAQYEGLRAGLDPAVELFYSLKANPNAAVCAYLHGLGAGAEVSSLAELLTAQRAGVPAADTVFPGPGKPARELAACLDLGVHAVVCESVGELAALDELARIRAVRAPVAIRVNPSFTVRASTLAMGGKPRQFGIDEDQLSRDLLARFANLDVLGIHVYMGTRLLDAGVVVENTARILELAGSLADRLGLDLRLVDVGGGLGVPYFDGEADLDLGALVPGLNRAFAAFRATRPGVRLVMELGRYLTAPAGTYLMRVRYTKTSQGRRFAITDGGTHHHMAAVGIGSFVKRDFPMFLASRAASLPDPADDGWTVAGPLCTPNDTLGKNVALPALRPGDLIGVRQSGAYGPTASPGLFLSHGYPAEVLVHDGRAYLVRDRDEPADLLAKQHLPKLPALVLEGT
jgi:diaminopimelate decarboxylase